MKTTPFYYQQNDGLPTNYRYKNPSPRIGFNILRNITIVAGCIGFALFTYTITSMKQTTVTNLSILNNDDLVKYSLLDNNAIKNLFEEFKTTYQKTYSTIEEETLRYSYFYEFLQTIDERNGNDTLAIHGITKFADLSKDEFAKSSLGYKPSSSMNTTKFVYTNKYEGSETYVNWADLYTTSVKDQGYCGSCWAFSATEQIESDAIRLGLLTTSDTLSPEQIVQCDTVDDGCGGGNTETAFEYVQNAGGIESDALYPYTSYYDVTGSCSSNANDYLVTVDKYYSLYDEDSMMAHIFSTGPISVCLDASSWSSYVSGIITTCGMSVDHCVQAVGLNLEEGYWIVRNSWGTEWGNEGYIYLESGSNMCNIAYDPIYLDVSLVV